MYNQPVFLIVDLFCGAGGTTTGFAQATIDGNPVAKVIACVNHDPKAIKSHWFNHPEVKHFEEDIRKLDLTELTEIVKTNRVKYPNAYLILWASLECTNFSKAKGGQPRDADSRTLAEHLPRYIKAIDPDYVQIENVVEFMSWGPLNEKGKPVSKKNGQDWIRWCGEMCSMGFYNEWKELNSANFGAYTSRNRLFGVFAKHGLPIAWPEPTHAKKPSKQSMYGDLQQWKAVKEVLNFSNEGQSIFTRKKELSEKTLQRIYAGLIKYVAKGDTSFISKYYSGRPAGKVNSVHSPGSTITTAGNQSLVQAQFLLKYNSMNKKGKHTPPSIEEPCPVIPAQGRLGIIQPQFLASYYGNGDNVSSIESPAPTLTTKDRVAVVNPEYFIDKHYGAAQNQSIDQPAGTILPTDKHRLVEATHFISNPSHGGHCTSADAPCPVIVARQDKAPLSVVSVEGGNVAIEVYEGDSETMILIKQFMVVYSIVDIKMRMLEVDELLKIQGFPAGYQMDGNQSDKKKFIGNSVVPQVVKAWAEAMADYNKQAATINAKIEDLEGKKKEAKVNNKKPAKQAANA